MKSLFIFNDISTFLLKKKLFNFYTNIVGNIPLITLPQSPADDALSINGNGGNAGDTGFAD